MTLSWQHYLVVEWSLIGTCIVIICVRLAVRSRKIMWSFWLSETLLIAALLTLLSLVVGDTYSFAKNRAGYGSYGTPQFQEWLFTADIIFDFGLYLPRFSLLAFYNELFPASEHKLRICLYVVIIYTTCACIGVGLGDLFWCGVDISKNWKNVSRGTGCSLLVSGVIPNLYIDWPIGIAAEILVFFLPFGMLPRLKSSSRRERIGMIAIFSLNIFAIIASIARFVHSALNLDITITYILGSTEMSSQIICVALPALRPLLRVFKPMRGYLGSSQYGTLRSDKLRVGSESTGPSDRISNGFSYNRNSYKLADIHAMV